MELEALKTFLAIHRAGGFSSAADRLARSQPAISRRIALLEAELKAPLFERTGAGVVLSQAGHVLLPYAERLLATAQDAADALAALRSGDAGPLALGLVGTLASTNLTAILKLFGQLHPRVDLTLRTATSDEVSALVRGGEIAIGLRYHDDPAPDLVSTAIAAEKLVVVCGRRHRLAGKSIAKLADLKAERWFAFPLAQPNPEAAAQILHVQFLLRGVATLRWTPIDSLTAQKRLVEAGYGLALVPESAIEEELKAKALATIRVRDLAASNPIVAVARKSGYLSEAAKQLIGILKTGWAPSRAA